MKTEKMLRILLILCCGYSVLGATDSDTSGNVDNDRNGPSKADLMLEITSLRQLVNQESLYRQELERQVREFRQQMQNGYTPKLLGIKAESSNVTYTCSSTLSSVMAKLGNIARGIEAKNKEIERITNMFQILNVSIAESIEAKNSDIDKITNMMESFNVSIARSIGAKNSDIEIIATMVQSLNVSMARIVNMSQSMVNEEMSNPHRNTLEAKVSSEQDSNKDGSTQSDQAQKLGNILSKYGKGHMGKSFAIMVPTGLSGRNMPIHLIISTESNTQITMRSSYPGLSKVFSVTPPGKNLTLPGDFALRQIGGAVVQSRGIVLESAEYVSVYVFHEDGYVAIPARYFGTHYKSLTTDHGDSFITIMPYGGCASVDITSTSGVSNRKIYIPELTVYYLWSSSSFKNLMISSNQTIAVISGHVKSFTGNKQTIYDSILPINQWNNSYIIPYLQNTTSMYDFYYSTTTVRANTMRNFQKNQITINVPYQLFNSKNTVSNFVQASQGIISVVLWYYKGTVFNSFMSVVPSLSQFSNNYHFWTPFYSNDNFLAAIIKEEDRNGLMVDNSTVTNPYMSHSVCTFDKVTYRVLTISVAHGWHSVKHIDPGVQFGLIMYGGDLNVAYGLPLGLRLD